MDNQTEREIIMKESRKCNCGMPDAKYYGAPAGHHPSCNSNPIMWKNERVMTEQEIIKTIDDRNNEVANKQAYLSKCLSNLTCPKCGNHPILKRECTRWQGFLYQMFCDYPVVYHYSCKKCNFRHDVKYFVSSDY